MLISKRSKDYIFIRSNTKTETAATEKITETLACCPQK